MVIAVTGPVLLLLLATAAVAQRTYKFLPKPGTPEALRLFDAKDTPGKRPSRALPAAKSAPFSSLPVASSQCNSPGRLQISTICPFRCSEAPILAEPHRNHPFR